MSRYLRCVLLTQALYYILTAGWSLVDISSFMQVTGPKTDIWMVRSMALMFLSAATAIVINLYENRFSMPTIILSLAVSFSMIIIDFIYVAAGVISPVYRIDGLIHLLILAAVLVALGRRTKNPVGP